MPMEPVAQINIELQDTQWPLTYTDHDREIVRAIVVDDANCYYFVRALRNDDFGAASLIETSGGGVEPGEDLESAIHRELREELGAQVEILAGIGVVMGNGTERMKEIADYVTASVDEGGVVEALRHFGLIE